MQDDTSLTTVLDRGHLPDPTDFPPARLTEYLAVIERDHLYRRDEDVKCWLDVWTATDRKEQAFSAIREQEKKGVEMGNYDALFDLALSLHGKEKAYPWLVKAHIRGYGWSRYFVDRAQAVHRWEKVKNLYPDRWYQFVLDTVEIPRSDRWERQTAYHRFVRLAEYCMYMEQIDVAREISQSVVETAMELVSPLHLPVPSWVHQA